MESFEIKMVLGESWKKFKEHFVFLWILCGVYIGSVVFLSLLGERFEEGSIFEISVAIFAAVIGTIIQIGFMKALLILVSSNEEKGISFVFSQYHLFFRYFVASIMYQILVVLGFILLIVPGVYFMLKYQFYSYVLIDKNSGIMDSFKQSGEMTRGLIWKLFGFSLVLLLINVAGAIFFLVGLAVTIPLSLIAYVYVYFALQKRLVVETAPPAPVTPMPEFSDKTE